MSEADTELTRYGVAWNGPTNPICQEMNDGLWTPWRVAHAEIARLRAERDALAKDAARYRWLRDESLHDDGFSDVYIGVDSVRYPSRWALRGKEADEAIDAAMEGRP